MANRIQQPSGNPFAQGALVIDTAPYLQFEMQERARRDAAEKTLDQYFTSSMKMPNAKGIRPQEQQLIMQLNEDRKKFYLANRDVLLKGTPEEKLNAKLAFEQYGKDIMDIAAESQVRSDALAKTQAFKQKSKFGVIDEEALITQAIPAHEEPTHIMVNGRVVRNPKHIPLNPLALRQQTKPYEAKDEVDFIRHITSSFQMQPLPPTSLPSTIANQRVFVEKKAYTEPQLKAMAEKASQDIKMLPTRFKETFEALPQAQKEQYVQSAIQRHGKNILNEPNYRELVMAEYFIDRIPKSEVKQSMKTIPSAASGGGTSGGGTQGNFVTNFKTALEKKGTNAAKSVLSTLTVGTGGSRELVFDDAGNFGDVAADGTITVNTRRKASTTSGRVEYDYQTIVIKSSDPDYYNKLGKLYQEIVGADAKLEKAITGGSMNLRGTPKVPNRPQTNTQNPSKINLMEYDRNYFAPKSQKKN